MQKGTIWSPKIRKENIMKCISEISIKKNENLKILFIYKIDINDY